MQGLGSTFFSNGEVYQGDHKDNKREGFGRIIWKNGSYYIGNWFNDHKKGQGTLVSSSGSAQCGIWDFDIILDKCSNYEEIYNDINDT